MSLHATFRGAKHPLSNGWVVCVVCGGKARSIICCLAATEIVSGQQWAECPTSIRITGVALGDQPRLITHDYDLRDGCSTRRDHSLVRSL